MSEYTYLTSSELPAWRARWFDGQGLPVNLAPCTFSLKLVNRSGTVALNKTSGITGNDQGVVVVQWASGELNLTPGKYKMYLIAYSAQGERAFDPANPPTITIVQAP